ncbi:metallophosphoesterase family protein [Massilia soli]|uniref:Phosphoesterase n=1 Tax=Massilia soli TaxID=2792854 RepID=A0ABS7SUV4_9BURK|nr:metallophosphoesterase family protein [Massilia soli]MBZ2209710.1 metallophosphatase family protein [Massilia soli]
MKKDTKPAGQWRIGVISDTHGLLRPEALALLAGSDYIIHGGDIGKLDILEVLGAMAPLTVVRGNNDRQDWARNIPESARLSVGGVDLFAVHDIADDQGHSDGAKVVISGHSHKPAIAERDGKLFLNPGSAGPRRFKLPISVAEILICNGDVTARIIEIAA